MPTRKMAIILPYIYLFLYLIAFIISLVTISESASGSIFLFLLTLPWGLILPALESIGILNLDISLSPVIGYIIFISFGAINYYIISNMGIYLDEVAAPKKT